MLKILTVNLNYVRDGYGPWPERCTRLRALLQAERPAIIALQAAHVDDTRNQLRELAGDLDYHHQLFLAADTTHPHQGSAILSEIPLSAPWSFALPRDDDDEDPSPRRVISASFAWQGEIWRLTNAHCSWVPTQNRHQVAALAQALEGFSGPQCLVGDFNAPPTAPGIAHLTASGWVDAHACVGQGTGATFPAEAPQDRIDYLFVHGCDRARLLATRTFPEQGPALSDHKAAMLIIAQPRETTETFR